MLYGQKLPIHGLEQGAKQVAWHKQFNWQGGVKKSWARAVMWTDTGLLSNGHYGHG